MSRDSKAKPREQFHSEKGIFVLSLDTELGWGCFDTVGVGHYEPAYRKTREAIARLCDLFDHYDVPVTWALVMHMLDDCTGHAEMDAPEFDWVRDWFDAAPCASGVDEDLWYGPEILETIRSREIEHEIALHGYSHMILGAPGCTREAARSEIKNAVEVADEFDITPETFVFPRNRIGHLDVLREFGIENYRGRDAHWYERTLPESLRGPFRFAAEFTRRPSPAVTPRERAGMCEIPGSQFFRPCNGKWRYTPEDSQVVRALDGIEHAAETGRVFHLWFHPFNVAIDLERHLELLGQILDRVAELRAQDRLLVRPIGAVPDG